MRRTLAATVLLLACGVLRADTIVLKNGRRIVALVAVEEGDKVRYQTSAGELILPKSIVDHIEKGETAPLELAASAARDLAITPPALDSKAALGEVERGTVHDGSIDRNYVAALELAARQGGAAASQRAALAHYAASQFELTHGDMEHALADARTALTFAPDEPVLLMDVAYLHLRRSEFRQSLDYLERARQTAPDNAQVAKLAGWAWYGLNRPDEAVAEWKRAQAIHPDAEVAAALEKAERDKEEEAGYKENESPHFKLRYSGAATPALAREVLHTLEAHFSAIESELNFSPPDSVGVILYTQQAFVDITRTPGWVSALNDGRIRVPVQGLTGMTPELSRSLKHELTHSFVQQKTHGRAPTWLQEGLAEWMEGHRSAASAAGLIEGYQQMQTPPLEGLEGSWMGMRDDVAHFAYAWSLANVEYIIQVEGMGDVQRILEQITVEATPDAALRAVLHSGYDDLAKSTVEYLKKTYGH